MLTDERLTELWNATRIAACQPAAYARAIEAEVRAEVFEECAIAAWSAGMGAHNKNGGLPMDAREVGSKGAQAIRAAARSGK